MGGTCEGCGGPLIRSHQVKFCSNKCQRATERAERARLWLETGVAATISGNRRHYIKRFIFDDQHGC